MFHSWSLRESGCGAPCLPWLLRLLPLLLPAACGSLSSPPLPALLLPRFCNWRASSEGSQSTPAGVVRVLPLSWAPWAILGRDKPGRDPPSTAPMRSQPGTRPRILWGPSAGLALT